MGRGRPALRVGLARQSKNETPAPHKKPTLTALAFVLGSYLHVGSASACKRAIARDLHSLASNHVIFAGRALEQQYRCWDPSRLADEDERWGLGDTSAATRFSVAYSKDLALGSEALVFTNPYSDCAPFFRVGVDSLVVARRLAGHLLASECPALADELKRELVNYLETPGDAASSDSRRSPTTSPPKAAANPGL